jgi:mannose-6-phosphate isomerase-like protein (cupin superfamily)
MAEIYKRTYPGVLIIHCRRGNLPGRVPATEDEGKPRRHTEAAMDANGLVVMPGMGPAWKMAPGRSSTLKLRNDETEGSVMMFEEVAPIGTVTPMHLHHDSDEVAYVLSGEITFKIGDTVTVGGPGTCAFM